ncbi:hypothetical protein [Streptomyces chartreusis]|uniref:hypothetical protein n=1 Tax=Streptomyces chartreusis TaxID=1969 RepID=UPI00380B44EB
MNRRAHRIPHSAVRFRNRAAVSLALGAAFALAACSSSEGNDDAVGNSPTVTQSPTETASADPRETAKKEAIAAYQAYWKAMEQLYADKTGKSGHLDQYAASAALKNAEADAKRAHDRGRIVTGSVALTEQTVTKVEADGRIPYATVSSCLDISKWQKVDAKSKEPVSLPDDRLTKYVIVSTVEKYPEGWRVTSDEPQGKSC